MEKKRRGNEGEMLNSSRNVLTDSHFTPRSVHSKPLDHFLADLRATRQVDHPKLLRKESLIDAIYYSTTRYGREDGICCNVRCCAAYDDAEDTNVLVFRVKVRVKVRMESDGSRLSTNARTESLSTVEHPSN